MGEGLVNSLFIGAHNDDCEYGAGGLAYLLAQNGCKNYFLNVACKILHEVNSQEMTEYARQEKAAAAVLGAEKIITGDRDDEMYMYSFENIRLIKHYVENIQPKVIFIHWPHDNHLEHVEVSRCSMAALSLAAHQGIIRNNYEVFAYEAGPYQTMQYFIPDFFVDISECFNKVEESLIHFDQPSAQGKWLVEEKKVCSRFRGHMAGCEYAEAYKILKFPSERGNPEMVLPRLLKPYYIWAGKDFYPWGRQYFI